MAPIFTDYSKWGILEVKICTCPHANLKSLNRHLLKAWDKLNKNMLRAAVNQFPKPLRIRFKKYGGHLENVIAIEKLCTKNEGTVFETHFRCINRFRAFEWRKRRGPRCILKDCFYH